MIKIMGYIALLLLGSIISNTEANSTMKIFTNGLMANSGLTSSTIIFDEEVPSLAGKNTKKYIVSAKLLQANKSNALRAVLHSRKSSRFQCCATTYEL